MRPTCPVLGEKIRDEAHNLGSHNVGDLVMWAMTSLKPHQAHFFRTWVRIVIQRKSGLGNASSQRIIQALSDEQGLVEFVEKLVLGDGGRQLGTCGDHAVATGYTG